MTEAIIFDLDDGRALEPAVAGAKAAMLARARRAGLAVLDGFVISAPASLDALAAGSQALESGNSGRARATITGFSLDESVEAAIAGVAGTLGGRLVVRSSAPVEADGAWAGAFASYAELAPDEVVHGVRGCWASVLAPDPLERARATGVDPTGTGMGVLIQPEIIPDYGGVATVDQAGTVTIVAIAGPPAAVVSGWERGLVVVSDENGLGPGPALETIGEDRMRAVADLARAVATKIGAQHIEWAEAQGRLWLLQAQSRIPKPNRPRPVGEPPRPDASVLDVAPAELVRRIGDEVRQRPASGRSGITKWEPALHEIVSSRGVRSAGTPAAPGWGAGPIRLIRDADDARRVEPRQVIAAVYPLANLAPVVWNAAGLVTIGGSPGAHLFEVAAWLGLPAVCGVDLEAATGRSLEELGRSHGLLGALDGDGGIVTVLDAGIGS